MKIDIHLRDNTTGERYVYYDDSDWAGWDEDRNADYQIEWMFGDGNYACDCNRALYFEAAKTGKWPNNPDRDCGHERYTIERIVERGTDRVVYYDDDEASGL
jgi:hypothetical protein